MSSYLQASMREANGPHKIDVWQESLNPDEVVVLVTMLQVLPGYFYIIKLSKPELA